MKTIADETGVGISRVQWSAVIAGALAATALAAVLQSFAAAIGLAVTSSAPTWRDSSAALWILSGIYLILVALASYGLGGYVAGWVRSWSAINDNDIETVDGIHGLLVWALATLLTVIVIATAIAATKPTSSAGTSAVSVAGENLVTYDVDRLFRGDGRYPPGDTMRARGEASRILLSASGHAGVSSEDRAYLTRLVIAQTNLSPPEAERRVDSTLERAKESINRARRSAVILAFMAGAAALLGAVAAWYASIAGAGHANDRSRPSVWAGRTVGTRTSIP